MVNTRKPIDNCSKVKIMARVWPYQPSGKINPLTKSKFLQDRII